MKRRARAGLAFVVAAGLTLTVSGVPAVEAQRPVLIKLASPAPAGSVWHRIMKQLENDWKKISGGKVKLRIYPGQTAGDDPVVVRKMRLGTLHAALLAGVGSVVPEVYALQIPMLYRSFEEADYVREKMTPRLDAAFAAQGFVVLNWTDAGWVHFFTKQPVKTPDDLKRTKLFAWAGDTDLIETYKAAGMNPIPLPSTEVSTALQTGLVTAMPAPTQAAVALQWFKHANHMTNIRWTLLVGATVVTQKAWQKVPAELRPELIEAARAAGERLRTQTRQSSPKDIAAMQQRGLDVVEVDAATQMKWEKLVEDAYPRIRGTVIPADAFDEARRLLEEYRSGGASND